MKPEDFVCLPRLVRDYLNYLSSVKGKSQLTVCEYASDLRLFFAYMLKQENLSQYKNTPIDEIDISKLDIDFISLARIPTAYGFLEYCRAERGNDTAARARKVVSIKRFYRYLKVQGYVDENPMQDLESPKIKKSLPKYLSLEQAVSLLESVDGKNKERDYCILVLFMNCGMRLSELVSINYSDIKPDNTIIITGKGNKQRTVYLNNACLNAIKDYMKVRPVDGVKDKEALFLAMVDYIFDSIKESEQMILTDPALGTIEKLQRILGVLPEGYQNIDLRKLYSLRDKYPKIYHKVELRLETGWEPTIQLIETGMAEGSIRPVPICLVKMMLEASIEQFFQRDILAQNHLTYVDALNEVVNILMYGITQRQ